MRDVVERLDALCDAVPFHASWYLKDVATGARADRLGDVPVPSASTRKISIMMAALAAVHAGKLSLDQKVTVEAATRATSRHLPNTSRPGSGSRCATRWYDDHRQRQHVHGDGDRSGRLPNLQRWCETVA